MCAHLQKQSTLLITRFKMNGISHSYQLDESISNLRVIISILHFYQILTE